MNTINPSCVRLRRRFLALAVVAPAILWSSPAVGQAPETATSNTPLLKIPFDTAARLVIVPVRVDGSRPLRCVLDTGMPEGMFLFDPAVGDELGLEYVATVPVRGTGPAPGTSQRVSRR